MSSFRTGSNPRSLLTITIPLTSVNDILGALQRIGREDYEPQELSLIKDRYSQEASSETAGGSQKTSEVIKTKIISLRARLSNMVKSMASRRHIIPRRGVLDEDDKTKLSFRQETQLILV
jgi:hypothetical protein